MTQIVVGISDCRVSSDRDTSLVTYALGSCIAVILYEPSLKIGGMLHFMLPESTLDQNKAAANPCMFADTGIAFLLEQTLACGADRRKLQVLLAGGAAVLDPHNVFAIGKRNYLAAKKILWKLGLLIASESVGGEVSRTVRLEIASGRSWLREGGRQESEFAAATNRAAPGMDNPALNRNGSLQKLRGVHL